MGIPIVATSAPAQASGIVPAGDKATAVVSGTFAAVGPSAPFAWFGQFNVSVYPTLVDALTTTAASATAVFADATGLAAGEGVNSTLVPPGTTIGAVQSSVTVTLKGLSATQIAAIAAGTDAAATLNGKGVTGIATVQLERSFDGGATWINVTDRAGTVVAWTFGAAVAPVSFSITEPEKGVAYRLNCTAYTNGTYAYRFSSSNLGALTTNIP